MSITPDPHALLLLNSLVSGAQNASQGIARGISERRNQRLAQQAISDYTQEPESLEKLINLSQYVDISKVANAAETFQAIKERDKKAQQIENTASILQTDENLLALLTQHPNLLKSLESLRPPEPLAHLAPEERKIYFDDVQTIDQGRRKVQLGRAIRSNPTTGNFLSKAKQLGFQELKPANVGGKKDIIAQGEDLIEQGIAESVNSTVRQIVYEQQGLSPKDKANLIWRIQSSPEYKEFLAEHEEDIGYGTGGLNTLDRMLTDLKPFVEEFIGVESTPQRQPGYMGLPSFESLTENLTTPQASEEIKEEIIQTPQASEEVKAQEAEKIEKISKGEIVEKQLNVPQRTENAQAVEEEKEEQTIQSSPVVEGQEPPTTPSEEIQEPTSPQQIQEQEEQRRPSQEISQKESQTTPQKLESPQVSETDSGDHPKYIDIKGSKNEFIQNAKSHPKYKDFSAQDLGFYYDQHKYLEKVRKSSIDVMVANPEYIKLSAKIGPEDALNFEDPKIFSSENAKVVKNAIKSALYEDMFLQGIKAQDASKFIGRFFGSLSDDQWKTMLKDIHTSKDLNDAIDTILGNKGTFLKELPQELQGDLGDKILDTIAVGGVEGGLAFLDSLAVHGGLLAVGGFAPGVGWGLTALAVAGHAYRYYNNLKNQNYYNAFFSEPGSATQDKQYYDLRQKFIKENKGAFTPKEQRQLLNNTFEDKEKLMSILGQRDVIESIIGYTTAPATTIAEQQFHLQDKIRHAHPNYDESFVLGAQIFGGVSGGNVVPSWKLAQKAKMYPKAPLAEEGATQVFSKTGERLPGLEKKIKETLLQKKLKADSAYGFKPTLAEKIYKKRLNDWAKSPGTDAFATFSQQSSWWTTPVIATTTASLGSAGIDKLLQYYAPDSMWLRGLANIGIGSVGNVMSYNYYSRLNKAFDYNRAWEADMFEKFARFSGGKTSTTPQGTEFHYPTLNKTVVQTPEGTYLSKPLAKKFPQRTPPEGSVTKPEFKQAQEFSFMSYAANSQDLGFEPPNFSRTPMSHSVYVDNYEYAKYLNQTREFKRSALEKARIQDLKETIPVKLIEENLGTKLGPDDFPDTATLRNIAQQYYTKAHQVAETSHTGDTQVSLQKALNAYRTVYHGEPHATKGNAKPIGYAVDIQNLIHDPEFTVDKLISKRRQLNKDIRTLEKQIKETYDEDKVLLLEQYKFLKGAIDKSLPENVASLINTADDFYFGYKYSESVDAYQDKLTAINDVATWLKTKPSFKKEADDIYSTFKTGNVANTLKKIMLNEDYAESSYKAPNVGHAINGKIVERPQFEKIKQASVDQFVDTKNLTLFSFVGKFVRPATAALEDSMILNKSEVFKKAAQGGEFIAGAEFAPLLEASKDAGNLRKITAPKRTQSELAVYEELMQKAQQRRERTLLDLLARNFKDLKSATQYYKDNIRSATSTLERSDAIDNLKDLYHALKTRRKDVAERLLPEVDDQLREIETFMKEIKHPL